MMKGMMWLNGITTNKYTSYLSPQITFIFIFTKFLGKFLFVEAQGAQGDKVTFFMGGFPNSFVVFPQNLIMEVERCAGKSVPE